MADVVDAHRVIGQRVAEAGRVQVVQPRRGICEGDAMAGAALLRGGTGGEQDQGKGKADHHASPLVRAKDSTV
ncbi:hypothetical protein [Roseovarius nitratireducens]|uniref:hypothetical protein n=1 Tax=Roseovarius nitratireducens TaxID=2044597 RepID=UPI001F0C362C|nr:hypothetical protein [Roseovarius nitratireducens]